MTLNLRLPIKTRSPLSLVADRPKRVSRLSQGVEILWDTSFETLPQSGLALAARETYNEIASIEVSEKASTRADRDLERMNSQELLKESERYLWNLPEDHSSLLLSYISIHIITIHYYYYIIVALVTNIHLL